MSLLRNDNTADKDRKKEAGSAELCTDSASRLKTKNIAGEIIARGLKNGRIGEQATPVCAHSYDVRMTKNAFSEILCRRGTRNRDASWSGPMHIQSSELCPQYSTVE